MASPVYLAMTGAEFSAVSTLPPRLCWMACHFSPRGDGLINLPPALPAGSLVMLNDWLPPEGHDPERIIRQLGEAANDWGGVVLDFQRPDIPVLRDMAEALAAGLPCPVAVSEGYGVALDCPLFLSPCPHHTHLQVHLAPWAGRDIWLDLASDAETVTLTEKGATILPLPLGEQPEGGHWEEGLHCHYSIESTEHSALFTLWRTREDMEALGHEAEALGVEKLVGLWQEWGRYKI